MDATLSTLESETTSMNAQMTMASVMVKTTKTLARLNKMVRYSCQSPSDSLQMNLLSLQMPLADFQRTMQMFEQNMTANNIKQEMMNDAMDGVFEDDDEEATWETLTNSEMDRSNSRF